MADLDAIRQALAANLQPAADAIGGQVSAYMLAQPTPPALEIYPDKFFYDKGVHTDELIFKVRAIVGFTLDVGAQQTLDNMLDTAGPRSIKAALEAEPTLGGLVDDLRVEQSLGYRLYPVGERGHAIGTELTVCVIATR
jgi:hypothetical protein